MSDATNGSSVRSSPPAGLGGGRFRARLALFAGVAVIVAAGVALRDLPLVYWYADRLDDPDTARRFEAMDQLEGLQPALVVPLLIEHIRSVGRGDPKCLSRRRAFSIVARIDPKPTARLTPLLEDSDWIVRFLSACFLGGLGARGEPATVSLREATRDEHELVRKAAEIALERIAAALAARG